MVDVQKVEEVLQEIEALEGVNEAVLVSRSGMYIAGRLPPDVHTDTYSSMFAVLLGAADTATAELKENLKSVVVNLERSKIVVFGDGPKALFVLRVANEVRTSHLRESLIPYSRRLEEYL